jgi:hypothetical protein
MAAESASSKLSYPRFPNNTPRFSIFLFGVASLAHAPLSAQRTNENAVTQSGNAFGRSVENERVGLYSMDDVLGLSPIDAGNARIDGVVSRSAASYPGPDCPG